MINKLIIDDVNVELNDKTKVPYSYTFAQAGTHVVRYGIDNTDEICAYAFKDCTELSYISFPPEIKNIKRGAFKGCTSLEAVPLSTNIKYIGKEVFDGCESLQEITFEHNDPPVTYCTFPSQTILYVPNNQKYVQVDYEKMNLDGTVEYFTQNEWTHKYEKIYDVTFANEEGTYFRNKWDKLGDNTHVVEYKNRYPVENIEFTPSVSIKAGSTFNLSYTLFPDNVTNTQLYWYSTFDGFTIDTNTGVEGMIKVRATDNESKVGSSGKIIAYAESGVSFSSSFTLISSGNVEEHEEVDTNIYVTDININSIDIDDITVSGNIDNITIKTTNSLKINYGVVPTNATDNTVQITVNSENAVIDEDKVITFNEVGNYIVTLTATDKSVVSNAINVTVND